MKIQDREAIFILAEYDTGASKRGAAEGPPAVQAEMENTGLHLGEYRVLSGVSADQTGEPHHYAKNIHHILSSSAHLCGEIKEAIDTGLLPVLLSGDHSNAVGGMSGLKESHPDARIGVIWIDAHADLHSPYTTPSGNIHGMPLAALSGLDNEQDKKNEVPVNTREYWNRLKTLGDNGISPKFDLNDLVFIGIRDAEAEEWDVIAKHGIAKFEVDDIRRMGMHEVLNRTLEHLQNCDVLYVSFDADSLDPSISVGTGTVAEKGINLEEANLIFKTLLNHPKLGVFEVTEVNPSLDGAGEKMAVVIASLFRSGISI